MNPKHRQLLDAADDLETRWRQLDVQRFTGRPSDLDGSDRPGGLHLAEYQALEELHEASLNRAKRPSLVRSAITQLDAACSDAETVDLTARRRVSGRRLFELLRAYRTLPAGTVPLSSLNLAACAAWEVFQDPVAQTVTDTLLLRCSLGEFFKEAYTSELMRDALTLLDFGIAETDQEADGFLLERALHVLEPVQELLTLGELLDRHDTITAAAAIRHLAVVHEFYSFRAGCPREQRTSHLNEWLRLSVDAAAMCADQEEFNTQGYALINKAAALAELNASDPTTSQMQTLRENVEDVQAAQDLFAITNDDRGLAWSAIHLARTNARQYEISERSATSEELAGILRNMLEASIDAVSNSRRIDDEVAQGLASLYLCAAEKEAQRAGVGELSISDEPEIAERAREAARVLSSTHRLPQAARALQIAAQCELAIAGRAVDDSERSASHVNAMKDLTKAIAILDENGDLDRQTSERLIVNIHDSVAASVPRWRF